MTSLLFKWFYFITYFSQKPCPLSIIRKNQGIIFMMIQLNELRGDKIDKIKEVVNDYITAVTKKIDLEEKITLADKIADKLSWLRIWSPSENVEEHAKLQQLYPGSGKEGVERASKLLEYLTDRKGKLIQETIRGILAEYCKKDPASLPLTTVAKEVLKLSQEDIDKEISSLREIERQTIAASANNSNRPIPIQSDEQCKAEALYNLIYPSVGKKNLTPVDIPFEKKQIIKGILSEHCQNRTSLLLVTMEEVLKSSSENIEEKISGLREIERQRIVASANNSNRPIPIQSDEQCKAEALYNLIYPSVCEKNPTLDDGFIEGAQINETIKEILSKYCDNVNQNLASLLLTTIGEEILKFSAKAIEKEIAQIRQEETEKIVNLPPAFHADPNMYVKVLGDYECRLTALRNLIIKAVGGGGQRWVPKVVNANEHSEEKSRVNSTSSQNFR
jgi:hypothetical protein